MTTKTEQGTKPPASGSSTEDERAMSLIEHLKELRMRLVRASIGIFIGVGFGVFLVMGPFKLVDLIINTFAPLTDRPPVQSVGTTEEFTSYMTVALTVGLIMAMPVIVYQLLAFIVPGLNERERRIIYISLPFVTFFFVAGLAFGWFITVPTAIRFLIGFSGSELIESQPSVANFIRTITTLLLINGIVFELPVIIYVLAFLGVVTASQLAKYRRFAFLAVVIIAALITPTGDPINLALLAIPMYLLYELGAIMARFVPKR
ncbi:twin-arginine translocase subunit TatC [Candidatus Chloroploca asiatica]|nr:twin-arginine translocase subunit TatC [Candidatus Chloroploca asiatica]